METEQISTSKKKPSFKLVGNLVLAMKRFQAALNPTLDYGGSKKSRSSSPTLNGMPRGRTMSGPAGRAASGALGAKTLSGRPDAAGKQHGFKGNLLFKPLPPLASEQETTG